MKLGPFISVRKLINLSLATSFCFLLNSCATTPQTKSAKPATVANVRTVVCPAPQFLSSGITRLKPTTAEQLVKSSIAPPVQTLANEWNINGFANGNQSLYLSCYYSNRKILVFTLPLPTEFCMAKEADKKTYVECVKK